METRVARVEKRFTLTQHAPGRDNGIRFGTYYRKRSARTRRIFMLGHHLASLGTLSLAVLSALPFITIRPAQAQTETVLYKFCSKGGDKCTDGANPTSSLTSDSAGNVYGTTYYGGRGYGTVFELSPNGNGGWEEKVLHSFSGGKDGANPYLSHLIFDSAGNLYGTALDGGIAHAQNGFGTVFKLGPAGKGWKETVLYSFAGGTDGVFPVNGLIMDSQGNLYGTTAGNSTVEGTVFELSPSGKGWKEQTIYTADTDGAGLTMDTAGNIFGVSRWTAFELSPNGNGGWNPAVIYTFKTRDKQSPNPEGTLVFDSDGNLYGTTAGVNCCGGGNYTYGYVYELSPTEEGSWTFTDIVTFDAQNGANPRGGVGLDAAGNIYGATANGGGHSGGVVFGLIGPNKGRYKEKLYLEFSGPDGAQPLGSLIMDNAGNLYGTASQGGTLNGGLVFEVTP
jgi:uncharacterized repeat protein (TIGR03803 family)